MTPSRHNVGAFVLGSPTSPRNMVRHADLVDAYADGAMLEKDETREAYLSHFAFGPEMQTHFKANRDSVAGFVGPCWCRWLVLDIDRPDLADALADARKLVRLIGERYPETAGDVPVYFSGSKGFHVLIDLAHNPPPAVGFHRVARTLAEALANAAGARVDASIYDIAHIIRLPNTRHPRTGLFKRRVDAEALFALDVPRILEHAKNPAGDGLPSAGTTPARLADDWAEAERRTATAAVERAATRRDCGPVDTRAPRFFIDFLRFGVDQGERHKTLFQCAAYMTEQGVPPSFCSALLTEYGRDVGLTPNDVERQIRCGIEHALRQRTPTAEPPEGERGDAWEHPNDRLRVTGPAAPSFDFGANLDGPYSATGDRR